LTREKLQAAFATIKGFNTDVHPGAVTCSQSDHRCHKSPAWLAKDPGGPIRVLGVTTVEN
jgi:branched-chain amino acid transport system substrate-binding protein